MKQTNAELRARLDQADAQFRDSNAAHSLEELEDVAERFAMMAHACPATALLEFIGHGPKAHAVACFAIERLLAEAVIARREAEAESDGQ